MLILYLILLAAVLVRIIGLDWYLPSTYEIDEHYTVRIALGFLKSGNLNPGSFMWPSLYFYIQAIGYGLYYLWRLLAESIQSLSGLTQTEIFLVGRFTTALYGIGTVLFVYVVGQRMYSKRIGLISSLFLAFTLLHVRYSRLIRPDVPMVFFIILSFLCTYLIYEKGKTRYYVLAGIFAGLSIATKYGGAILVVPIFLAHLFRSLEERKTLLGILFDRRAFLTLLFIIIGFFTGCPYGLLYFSSLLRTAIGWTSRGLDRITINQPGEVSGWLYYITESLNRGMGQPLEIFSLAAVVYLIFRHRKKEILLLSFPLVYYLVMGRYLRHWDRYILPVVPFLVIAAAILVEEIASRISRSESKQNLVIAALILGVILFPALRVTRYVHLMTKKGTGLQAKEWIEENIPPGSRIGYEMYCPPISGYDRHNMRIVGYHSSQGYREAGFDYIIMSSFTYNRFFRTRLESARGTRKNYQELEANNELIQQFIPPSFSPAQPNPTIKIYKINYEYSEARLPFPVNFDQYSQLIRVERVAEGWMLLSRVTCSGRLEDVEYMENPYVRLVDPEGSELVKLIIEPRRIGQEEDPFVAENSLFLPSLPLNYKIHIGYGYGSSRSQTLAEKSPFKEFTLDFGEDLQYPAGSYSIDFVSKMLPSTHAAEYRQMVALFQSESKAVLWSRIFAGEVCSFGDDYVRDPYVRIADLRGREIVKLLVYQGKIGSLSSVSGPWENSVVLSFLSSPYKIYIGYQFYYDNRHPQLAGGPLEIEIAGELFGPQTGQELD